MSDVRDSRKHSYLHRKSLEIVREIGFPAAKFLRKYLLQRERGHPKNLWEKYTLLYLLDQHIMLLDWLEEPSF